MTRSASDGAGGIHLPVNTAKSVIMYGHIQGLFAQSPYGTLGQISPQHVFKKPV